MPNPVPVHGSDQYETVEALLYDAFHLSPFSHFKARTAISRQQFWDSLYVSRGTAEHTFQVFIDSGEARMLWVTGPIGCGKSTFLLEKCDGTNSVDSIYVDFDRTSSALSKPEANECRAALDRLLAQTILDRLKSHYGRALRTARTPTGQSPDESIELLSYAYTAAARLMSQRSDWATEEISKCMHGPKPAFAISYPHDVVDALASMLVDQSALRKRLLRPRIPTEWIHCYMQVTGSKPVVVLLDNLDALWSTPIHSVVYAYIVDLLHECNRPSSTFTEQLQHPPVKFVLSARDHNIRRVTPIAGGRIPTLQIVLVPFPKRFYDFFRFAC